MKILKLGRKLVVTFSDGSTITNNNCDDVLFAKFRECETEDEIKALLRPEYKEYMEKKVQAESLRERANSSEHIEINQDSFYMPAVSDLSLPITFVEKFLQAEKEGNEELIETYTNFWTLCSLNPDSVARDNMFWFLERNGFKIAKSGLFVAYRNVDKKNDDIPVELAKVISETYVKIKFKWKKSPKNYMLIEKLKYIPSDEYEDAEDIYEFVDECLYSTGKYKALEIGESPYPVKWKNWRALGNVEEMYKSLALEEEMVFTDNYTRTFDIRIGVPVTMDRDKCDHNPENECSRGLHVASKSWLTRNYFGNVSLVVLVNPADVVAVPRNSEYGKMRTCAYYPIAITEFDEEGNIKEISTDDGFEDDFMSYIVYDGKKGNEDKAMYKLNIPVIPGINQEKMENLLEKLKEFTSEGKILR